jgi:Methylamine utilisation protein MauE
MNVGGIAVLAAARDIQVPLLAVLLLGGCVAKLRRAIHARSMAPQTGPTALFPVRLHRPVAVVVYVSELALALGLLVTAGRFGAGMPATVIRLLTVVLFGTAVGALHELRNRRPDAGCGCFGDLSDTPVGWRTMTRSALLGAAAVASVGAPPLQKPDSAGQALVVLGLGAGELCVLAVLSPELGEIMVRLGYSEPCEVRRLPIARSLAALRASQPWRQYRDSLVTREPEDVWREGCWRFAVFPGMVAARPVEVVFAIYLKPRHPVVRVGVYDAGGGTSRALPAIPQQRRPAPLSAPVPVTLPLSTQL